LKVLFKQSRFKQTDFIGLFTTRAWRLLPGERLLCYLIAEVKKKGEQTFLPPENIFVRSLQLQLFKQLCSTNGSGLNLNRFHGSFEANINDDNVVNIEESRVCPMKIPSARGYQRCDAIKPETPSTKHKSPLCFEEIFHRFSEQREISLQHLFSHLCSGLSFQERPLWMRKRIFRQNDLPFWYFYQFFQSNQQYHLDDSTLNFFNQQMRLIRIK